MQINSQPNSVNIVQYCGEMLFKNERNGAPGKIRTPDPLIRSQVLYPAELPVLRARLIAQISSHIVKAALSLFEAALQVFFPSVVNIQIVSI